MAQSLTGGTVPTGKNAGGVLAAVPYMGWNTYYGVGGIFDERTILSVARALLCVSMRDAEQYHSPGPISETSSRSTETEARVTR